MATSAKKTMTEEQMLLLLRQRYTEKAGNGDAWAFVPHVRNKAGFDASRTVDAIAMGLWPSRGLLLHAFEIKCSRADWQRELKNPAKAEAFCQLVDRWWLAVSDEKIVRPGELPDGWGLLAVRGGRLHCLTEPKPLRSPNVQVPEGGFDGAGDPRLAQLREDAQALAPAFSRSFLASLMRAACRVSEATPADVEIAVNAAREEERNHARVMLQLTENELKEAQRREQEFERVAGVSIGRFSSVENVEAVARSVRAAMRGEDAAERVEQRIAMLRNQAQGIVDQADRVLAGLEGKPVDRDTLSF